MEFSENIFDGMPIGKKYVNGDEALCGDKVMVTEQIAEQDYEHPILDFDTGAFRLREINRMVQVDGRIAYSSSFYGFVFIPEKVHTVGCRPCQRVSYGQKPIWDIAFKAIQKI